MKNIPNTELRPFEIVIRDTPDSEPRVVETIQVEVIADGEDDYLTPESSALIERVRARHMGLMMGEDIKTMRARLGITQKELTDLLQCGEKSLSRWENGRGQPTGLVNTMLRLLDEGYIAPSSLRAVQGPRGRSWTPDCSEVLQTRKKPFHYANTGISGRIDLATLETMDRALAA